MSSAAGALLAHISPGFLGGQIARGAAVVYSQIVCDVAWSHPHTCGMLL